MRSWECDNKEQLRAEVGEHLFVDLKENKDGKLTWLSEMCYLFLAGEAKSEPGSSEGRRGILEP